MVVDTMTRSFTASGRTSHSNPRSQRYTTGGLLVYTAIVPALVVLLTAPAVLVAFTLGAATALLVRLLRIQRTDADSESRWHPLRISA